MRKTDTAVIKHVKVLKSFLFDTNCACTFDEVDKIWQNREKELLLGFKQ